MPPSPLKVPESFWILPTIPVTPFTPWNTSVSCFTFPIVFESALSPLNAKKLATTPFTIGPMIFQWSAIKFAKLMALSASFATASTALGMYRSAKAFIGGPARVNPSISLRPRLTALFWMLSKVGRSGSSFADMVRMVSPTLSLMRFATSSTFLPYLMPVCTVEPIFLPIFSKVPDLDRLCILSDTQPNPSLAASNALPSIISPVPLIPAI